jgi:3-methyladenine DNA glycosylase AlkD
VLIYSIRRNKRLKEGFRVADILLEDPDDLVQKGYGWMLKEATKTQQTKIFKYVIKNKNKMPRTALRYAIEKMPAKLKKEAMAK